MEVTQPARLTFWQIILFLSFIAPMLALIDLIQRGNDLNVVILESKSWIGTVILLIISGFCTLLALILTQTRLREWTLTIVEFPACIHGFGFILLVLSLVGFPLVFAFPTIRAIIGDLGWVRLLVFWFFSLMGMYGLKAIKKKTAWFTALLLVIFLQTTLHLLISQFASVTSYPFAMGWSETSRYYYPSLFLSEVIYGDHLPWPILHPSLHLLLVPPYLFDAPLWFHRFWQVFIRFTLLGLTAFVLLQRLSNKKRSFSWLLFGWMILYLFQGPVYFHLTVPLILMLWGFSWQDEWRTLLFLILASIWSGLSRLNWYPLPGLLASTLYLLEVPYQGNKFWRYLLKPAIWIVVGFTIALATQRIYIAFSGIPDPAFFYTSFSSNLLWYRLFPNASYSVGVLPAALIASIPLWSIIFSTLRRWKTDIHIIRIILIATTQFALLVIGLIVSMKIGGGVDIHNLDSYLSLLLIITTYVGFRNYAPEKGTNHDQKHQYHWVTVVLLVSVPAWFLLSSNVEIKTYDHERTHKVIKAIQAHGNEVYEKGGDILFITQRHLISMNTLTNIKMIPEYEREELMEMAMGNNQAYLQVFRADMENQRFAAIVVDPLTYRLLGKYYSFGEENNAWVRRIMKHILCNYVEDAVYAEDQIAIYVPQRGERTCPQK